ncbi:hypothetical protein BAUCODRAFT_31180 [Baudoinia panamericana UAMH 10762]|uniref:FAD dependent oxidoreductase domain-containing protein n=1 Tax=Baudoinia panamericana (strain UAMH 10762) TaxID=717646 RepID=M2NHS0_BAUPA|nr:uncharacterized protein BAUCODRAFT_31180 [Baudoinia panamericana UAMH 10762]EMC98904.1 hypothetical protein BAUCODRAFT_31180 [Baudoinia panamericana UAMH 10762]
MPVDAHILVLGAGVTGLTSAMLLAEAGYEVTIIAAHVPGDSSIEYTSPWAGAHWRTHASSEEPMLCDWDIQTYEYWSALLDTENKDLQLHRSGIKMYESYDYWDGPVTEDLWWAPYVRNFRHVSESQEPLISISKRTPPRAPQIANAVACRAMAINVPQYLLYLLEQSRSLGVKLIKARLPVGRGLKAALLAAESTVTVNGRRLPDCYVNATGLGARKLCGDEALYPIRGQTVLVKGEANAITTRIGEGHRTYCIPRPGSNSTILGGTREDGEWSETPDPKTTSQILERCSAMVPELLTGRDGGFEVISVQCGLRPGRNGGPRMEKEDVDGTKVVHAYGHAGAGYQNSVGSARLVRRLVDESLTPTFGTARL